MYAASSSVSAPPRPHAPPYRPAADRISTPPTPAGLDGRSAGGRSNRSAGESTCPALRARSCARLSRRCTASARSSIRSRCCAAAAVRSSSSVRRGGCTAVAKCLLDHSPAVVRAVPARNSCLPRVRPAPPTGAGAAAGRRGSRQLHAGDRADAGPGGGPRAAPGRGSAPRGREGRPRRDLPAQRLAAAGRDVRRPARLRGPDLPLSRAGVAHRPGPGRPAEAAARHWRTPVASRAWASSATATPYCPTSCCRRPVPCWSTGSTRAGICRGTTWRRCGRCSATRPWPGGRSASSPSRRGPRRGTRSW